MYIFIYILNRLLFDELDNRGLAYAMKPTHLCKVLLRWNLHHPIDINPSPHQSVRRESLRLFVCRGTLAFRRSRNSRSLVG